MNQILKQLGLTGLIPVVVLEDEHHAEPLAKALLEGGLPAMEITFRTDAAPAAVKLISAKFPDLLLGAGTILTIDQAKEAIDCGAKYIVSPALQLRVCEYCQSHDIPVTPGVLTPTEIALAQETGVRIVKFFPAEAVGGLPYLKAISAPFRGIDFIPTGGIDAGTMLPYLMFPRVHACGGSWMVRPELIASQRFDQIAARTKEAVAAMLDFCLLSGGSDVTPPPQAQEDVGKLSSVLKLPVRSTEEKLEYDSAARVINSSNALANCAVIVKTRFLDRAMFYCGRAGSAPTTDITIEQGGKIAYAALDARIGDKTVVLVEIN